MANFWMTRLVIVGERSAPPAGDGADRNEELFGGGRA